MAAVVVVLLTSVAVGLGAGPAGACSCIETSDEQSLERADVAFSGTVTGRAAPARPDHSTAPAVWTFEVDRVFKGEATSTQGVVSVVSGASCGLELPRHGDVLVFTRSEPQVPEAGLDGATLYAGLCDGSRALSEGLIPASFGDGRGPAPGESGVVDPGTTTSDLSTRAAVAGAGLCTVGVVLLLRRTRSRRPPPSSA